MDKTIKKKLFSGGLWVTGGKIIGLFCNLTINACLARLLAPEDMGIFFLIASLVNFSMLFSLFGMDRSIVRIVSESIALEQTERACDAVRNVLKIGLISSTLISIFLITDFGKIIAGKLFNSILIKDIMLFPAIWIIFFTLQRLIAESFRGFNDIRLATIFNGLLSSILSATGLCFVLWKFHKATLNLSLTIIISTYAINLLFALSFLFKNKLLHRSTKTKFAMHDLIKSSWVLYFTNMVFFILESGHLWILAYYSSKENVAIFGAVLRLVTIITSTLFIVRRVILPVIGHLYTLEENRETEKFLRISGTIAGIPAIAGLILVVIFGKNILNILYGEVYIAGFSALSLLSFAQLINVLTGHCGDLIVMASKEKVLLFFSSISIIIGFSSSILLVDSLSYFGVAIGASLSIIIQSLLQAWYCINKLSINTFIDIREIPNIANLIRRQLRNS